MSAGGRVLFTGLNASASTGEVIALMGPSGVGKSTLIAGVAGLVSVDAGEIRREEGPVRWATHWMFQSTPLLARRSALDNVALVGEMRGHSRELSLAQAGVALAELGLGPRVHLPAFTMSGGEKQRIAVARAVVSGAALILADEPTASLDPDTRSHVVSGLQRAAAAGAIVVIATHDRWVAEQCTRVVEIASASGDH
jgi:ABC-type lipoprotein export system ATPase subunit